MSIPNDETTKRERALTLLALRQACDLIDAKQRSRRVDAVELKSDLLKPDEITPENAVAQIHAYSEWASADGWYFGLDEAHKILARVVDTLGANQ